MAGSRSSAPLIDSSERFRELDDLGEMVEMIAPRHVVAPEVASTSGSLPCRPRRLDIAAPDAVLQEIGGRASPVCRAARGGVSTDPGAGVDGPRSPRPRNTFQATRRTSKRCKTYSYKDFLPEFAASPVDDQTFKLVALRV